MDEATAKQKFNSAASLYRQGSVAEALRTLQELRDVLPENKELLYASALCLIALGRDSEALPLAEKLKTIYADPRGDELQERISQWGIPQNFAKPSDISEPFQNAQIEADRDNPESTVKPETGSQSKALCPDCGTPIVILAPNKTRITPGWDNLFTIIFNPLSGPLIYLTAPWYCDKCDKQIPNGSVPKEARAQRREIGCAFILIGLIVFVLAIVFIGLSSD